MNGCCNGNTRRTVEAITVVCKAVEYAGAEPELEAGKGNGGVKDGKRDVIKLIIYALR